MGSVRYSYGKYSTGTRVLQIEKEKAAESEEG
jgi:hypothetical protein